MGQLPALVRGLLTQAQEGAKLGHSHAWRPMENHDATRHKRARGTQRFREATADSVTALVPTVLAPGPALEKPWAMCGV